MLALVIAAAAVVGLFGVLGGAIQGRGCWYFKYPLVARNHLGCPLVARNHSPADGGAHLERPLVAGMAVAKRVGLQPGGPSAQHPCGRSTHMWTLKNSMIMDAGEMVLTA